VPVPDPLDYHSTLPIVRRPSGVRASALVFAMTVIVASVAVGLSACSSDPEGALDCDPGPKPTPSAPPTSRGDTIGWLGLRYGKLRFHSVSRDSSGVSVNYGTPRPIDPCSGVGYSFPITVLTASRRPETRRRLQRRLGAGVRVKHGIRYGCRRAHGPARIAVLTATLRIEIINGECGALLRASRALRLT